MVQGRTVFSASCNMNIRKAKLEGAAAIAKVYFAEIAYG